MSNMEIILTIFGSVMASSGFWMVLLKILDKKSAKNKVIMGLAHDRIMELGVQYVNRGYITIDEYENLNDYLFIPYSEMGGNGTAKKIMDEVDKLPTVKGGSDGIREKDLEKSNS